MYANVLIPTDGSDGAATAITTGVELAAQFDATAHALFVVDERFIMEGYDMALEDAETEGEQALDAVGEAANDRGVPVEKHLRQGIPHEQILDSIEAYGIDLVVMGTNGRSGVERFVNLGSTAERVVRSSPVPVTTVPI